jgi:branched-chain amino acid aminotransferase
MILPGVTRQSLLDLARQWNEFKVSERNFSMADVKRAIKEKRVCNDPNCLEMTIIL